MNTVGTSLFEYACRVEVARMTVDDMLRRIVDTRTRRFAFSGMIPEQRSSRLTHDEPNIIVDVQPSPVSSVRCVEHV